MTVFVRQDRWYLIDFARGRPTNPARIPVGPKGRWYYTLVRCAWRYNPDFKACRAKTIAAGKPASAIRVALARKLLFLPWH